MATTSDLFSFDLSGKTQVKEQVTPRKISLLALIYEYCELKKKQTIVDEIEDVDREFMTVIPSLKDMDRLTEDLKRDFVTVILELLQVFVWKFGIKAKFRCAFYRISGIFRIGKFLQKCRLEGKLNFH